VSPIGLSLSSVLIQYVVNPLLSKPQRGFYAYKKNTGSVHPLDIQSGKALTRRATGSDPLTIEEVVDGPLWQGNILVGTPPKEFTGG
jgi:hypothetical protein